jgi:hypothetical protein
LEKLGFGENKIKLDNDDWVMEYLTNLTNRHHMGVSGNRFATHERGVNVRGIN